jgi:predicted N-formylglutamate amidohydrolase
MYNESGRASFLIVADHAGSSMPRALRRLGVPRTESERHIAWDIGIAPACRIVADAVGATLVQQNYSRLVIDCNRTPGLGDFDPRHQRPHADTRKYRVE